MGAEFTSRPYGGKTFRPRPEVHLDAEAGLLLVATPWGPRSVARKAIERMLEYLTVAKQDNEATTPFGRLAGLSPAANALRTAAMLANESILRDENKSEYKAGVELFAASFGEHEFTWVQAGAPQPFLARIGRRTLTPLGPQVDLALDLSDTGQTLLPALPSQLLGLDAWSNLHIGGFRARSGDQVVLLSCSSPAEEFYSTIPDTADLDVLSRTLAKGDPDQAFWLGILKLDDRKLSDE